MAYSYSTGDGDRIFAPVFADVWDTHLKHMTGSAVKVYVALLLHTTQHDRTWFMSIDEIAEDAGVSRDTARVSKDRLIEAGLFEQSWRYRDDAGDYHLTDTRPPPRLQAKNVYKVNVRAAAVDAENQSGVEPRGRKSASIEAENQHLVDAENQQQTITPSPEPPPEPSSPLTPRGADDASVAEADAPRADDLEVEFTQWWSIVPRKKAKGDARKAFKAARKLASLDELTEGMIRSRRRWEAEGRDASKIPYPATWLRAESWADEDDDWSTPARPAAQGNTLGAWLGTQAGSQRPALDVADDAPFGDNVIEHDEGGALW